MNIDQELRAEYDREAQLTRKMLDAIPADADLTWKADPKSMTLGRLAGHVAETAGRWGISVLTGDGLNLSSADFKAFQPETKAEILKKFDDETSQVQQILHGFDPAKWDESWKLSSGDRTFFTDTRYRVFRTWVLNHQFHHRAQLGRDLRVMGARIPGVYGPSADEI